MLNKVMIAFIVLYVILLLIVLVNYIKLDIQIKNDMKWHRKNWIDTQEYKYLAVLRDLQL